jgi:uncharacterized protein (TIGR02466 family)
MLVPISSELSLTFGTPLSMRPVSNAVALNEALEQAILNRFQDGRGNRISNIGGWQSQPDLLEWPEPAIAQFASEVDRGVQSISTIPALLDGRPAYAQKRVGYTAYGWANVNQSGHYNTLHMHPGSDWSVVYYVSTGTVSADTPMNGRIELRDPRPAASFARMPGFTSGQPMMIKPQAGMMIVFPAWIEHWVHPFIGDGNRISIAVNVTLNRD